MGKGNYEGRHPTDVEDMKRDIELAKRVQKTLLTNPIHGGKVCCHKCNDFIEVGDEIGYHCYQNAREFPAAHFHKDCYNQYEHYYGLDKPID